MLSAAVLVTTLLGQFHECPNMDVELYSFGRRMQQRNSRNAGSHRGCLTRRRLQTRSVSSPSWVEGQVNIYQCTIRKHPDGWCCPEYRFYDARHVMGHHVTQYKRIQGVKMCEGSLRANSQRIVYCVLVSPREMCTGWCITSEQSSHCPP